MKKEKEGGRGRQTYSSPAAPILISCANWLSERMPDLEARPCVELPLTQVVVEVLSEFPGKAARRASMMTWSNNRTYCEL